MNTALILIDVQNDYFPKGKRELEGSIEASLQAKTILDFFRQKQLPIFLGPFPSKAKTFLPPRFTALF